MSKKTYEELKNDFKSELLQFERNLLINSEKIDNQQVVNKLVKIFDEGVAKELGVKGDKNED